MPLPIAKSTFGLKRVSMTVLSPSNIWLSEGLGDLPGMNMFKAVTSVQEPFTEPWTVTNEEG